MWRLNISRLTEDFSYYEINRSSSFWSPDEGYPNDDYAIYPERGYIAGHRSGLTVILMLFDYNFDYLCRGPSQGYKVIDLVSAVRAIL